MQEDETDGLSDVFNHIEGRFRRNGSRHEYVIKMQKLVKKSQLLTLMEVGEKFPRGIVYHMAQLRTVFS